MAKWTVEGSRCQRRGKWFLARFASRRIPVRPGAGLNTGLRDAPGPQGSPVSQRMILQPNIPCQGGEHSRFRTEAWLKALAGPVSAFLSARAQPCQAGRLPSEGLAARLPISRPAEMAENRSIKTRHLQPYLAAKPDRS